MNRIFGALLLLVAFNASAIEINSKLSGIWSNPSQSGHGLNVVTFDENTTIVYWYTYHTDGTPMFLITVGENSGNRTTGTTYYNTGMVFGEFDPNDIQESVWGSSTVTFDSCNSALLSYSSNEPGYGSGTIPMQRLASISGLKCSDSPLQGNYTTMFVDSEGLGIGAAMLFDNGDMAYFSIGEHQAGIGLGAWHTISDDHFTFEATIYSLFGGSHNISGSGEYSDGDLQANYTNDGRLLAFSESSFQKSVTYADLAGAYNIISLLEDEVIGSVTIQGNGAVTGSTYDGCNLNGWFYIPNTEFNQSYVDIEATNCASAGRLVGAAQYSSEEGNIAVIASDGYRGYFWNLE